MRGHFQLMRWQGKPSPSQMAVFMEALSAR
uniref:Dihydrolipoyllysine-residue succinyltransferase component of 2-oxoglutarate dehydrogenase complex n=1 Tax=Arundo donax TaxID=35708 RepID=A0A0A9AHZ5_ARUDO